MKIYFIFKLTTFSLSAKCATGIGNENKCVSRKNRCWNLRLLSLAHGVRRQQWNLAFPVEAGRDYIQRRQHSFKSNTSLLRVVRRRQWLMCLTHFDYYSISFEWLVTSGPILKRATMWNKNEFLCCRRGTICWSFQPISEWVLRNVQHAEEKRIFPFRNSYMNSFYYGWMHSSHVIRSKYHSQERGAECKFQLSYAK